MRARLTSAAAPAGRWLGARAAVVLDVLLPSGTSDRLTILVYHRVTPRVPNLPAIPRSVHPIRFEEQMVGLQRRGYRFSSLPEVLDRIDTGEAIPRGTVVVTFDDGYGNVYRNAFPILSRHAIPASIFLATSYIGEEQPFSFDPWDQNHHSFAPTEAWRPLDWNECREMAESGLIDIGSHTHTHGDFRGRPEDLRSDVRISIETMARHGLRAQTFSFPYGSSAFADVNLGDAVRQLGLRCALSTKIERPQPATSPFGWGRVEGTPSDTSRTLAAKAEGRYDWMEAGRNLYRRVIR